MTANGRAVGAVSQCTLVHIGEWYQSRVRRCREASALTRGGTVRPLPAIAERLRVTFWQLLSWRHQVS